MSRTLRELIAERDRRFAVYQASLTPLGEPISDSERTAKHAAEAAETAVQIHPLAALLDELSSDWLTTTGLDALVAAVDRESGEAERLRQVITDLLMSADCSWEEHNMGHDWAEAVGVARATLEKR